MTRPSYVVACQRSGDWWAVTVPEVPGVFTQARRLEQVRTMAREAVALMLDVDPDSFDLDLRLEVPELGGRVVAVKALRDKAARLSREASEATIVLARDLARQGLSVRDIGLLLSLSPQRVSQMVAVRRKSADAPRQVATDEDIGWAARRRKRKEREASDHDVESA
jgi:predicted RNase H-like HicB family nuclease